MVKSITRDELMQMVKSGKKFKLVDALPRESYAKEHIQTAISLPVDEIEKEAAKVLKKEDLIITYCGSFECPVSTKAAEKLISLGYQNVLDYKGGLKDYKEAGLPLEGSLYGAKTVKSKSDCGCGN